MKLYLKMYNLYEFELSQQILRKTLKIKVSSDFLSKKIILMCNNSRNMIKFVMVTIVCTTKFIVVIPSQVLF